MESSASVRGSGGAPGALTANEFREVIGRFATGVTVITANHDGVPRGSTASAVSSLSLEPPMILVCLNQSSATATAVAASGHFAVNVLAEGQEDAAMRFATRSEAKFDGVATVSGAHGVPLLGAALATFECRVSEQVAAGTHWVFLAEVERAEAGPGAPLAYFRGRFGRLELGEDAATLDELRGLVLDGRLPIEEPLDLDAVCASLGAPRGRAYHALARLVDEGLVRRGAGGAFTVPPISLATVCDALRARFVIERGVAAVTVGALAPDQLSALRERAAAAAPRDADGAAVERDAWVAATVSFFEHLVSLGCSDELSHAYRRLDAPARISSIRARATREVALPDDVDREFRAIVEGYERADVAAVEAALAAWMERTAAMVRRYLEQGPAPTP